jgi:hypothetical protein
MRQQSQANFHSSVHFKERQPLKEISPLPQRPKTPALMQSRSPSLPFSTRSTPVRIPSPSTRHITRRSSRTPSPQPVTKKQRTDNKETVISFKKYSGKKKSAVKVKIIPNKSKFSEIKRPIINDEFAAGWEHIKAAASANSRAMNTCIENSNTYTLI